MLVGFSVSPPTLAESRTKLSPVSGEKDITHLGVGMDVVAVGCALYFLTHHGPSAS
jgi:hypothetical protein